MSGRSGTRFLVRILMDFNDLFNVNGFVRFFLILILSHAM